MIRVLCCVGLSLFVSGSLAFASETDSCASECPSGQVQVSFGDGNSARCVCQEQGAAMEETSASEIDCTDPEDDGTCE